MELLSPNKNLFQKDCDVNAFRIDIYRHNNQIDKSWNISFSQKKFAFFFYGFFIFLLSQYLFSFCTYRKHFVCFFKEFPALGGGDSQWSTVAKKGGPKGKTLVFIFFKSSLLYKTFIVCKQRMTAGHWISWEFLNLL